MNPPRTPRLLPALGPDEHFPMPPWSDTVLGDGLRVVAVKAPSVPLVEVRLRIPLPTGPNHPPALREVLARALLHGRAPNWPGAALTAGLDSTGLTLSGTTSAAGLLPLLESLATALTPRRYDDDVCRAAVRRVAAHSALTRAQPATHAREALLAHAYGDAFHRLMPSDEDLAAVTAGRLTALHSPLMGTEGAVLVLVGDLDPEAAIGNLPAELSQWPSPVRADIGPARTPTITGRGIASVPRPGAVQSQILLAAPAFGQSDPRFPALSLAGCALGGSFSSRLALGIREARGIAYRTSATLDEYRGNTFLLVQADTATRTTGAALREIQAELGRFAADPPSSTEIHAAREFIIGATAASAASQAGMAEFLLTSMASGFGPEWLHGHVAALRDTTRTDVVNMAQEFYAPARFTGVVIGAEQPADLAAAFG